MIIYPDWNSSLAFQLSLTIGRIVEGKNCRIINHNKQTKLIYLMCRDNRPNLSHIHFHYVNELTAEPNSERIRLDGLQMGSNPTQPIACCSPTLPKNLNQAPTPTCSAITTPTRKIKPMQHANWCSQVAERSVPRLFWIMEKNNPDEHE